MLLSHLSFLSTIDCFKVFSYKRLFSLIQSCNLVYRIFNFEMYSSVIKIAILVNRAVLFDVIMPAHVFKIANILELIVEADPNKRSVIIKKVFFSLIFFIFSYDSRYQF